MHVRWLPLQLHAHDLTVRHRGRTDIPPLLVVKAFIVLTEGHEGLFLYLVLDKGRANLAMARHKLASIEKNLEV